MCGQRIAAWKYTPRGISAASSGTNTSLNSSVRDTVPRMPSGSQSPTTDMPCGLGRQREIERVAARGLLALGDLGAEHAVIVGMARQRGKDLLAVDDPAALDRFGLGAERDAAGRGRAAFRERLRIDRAVVDDAPVMHGAPLLVLVAGGGVHVEVVGQRAGPQRRADMHVPGQRGGAAIAADFGGGQRIGLVVRAEPAMLPGDGDAEQAGVVQVAVILGREFRFAVIGRGAAREHRLAELARARDDFGLFVVEAERMRDRRSARPERPRRSPPRSCLPVPSSCRHLGCSHMGPRGIDPARR